MPPTLIKHSTVLPQLLVSPWSPPRLCHSSCLSLTGIWPGLVSELSLQLLLPGSRRAWSLHSGSSVLVFTLVTDIFNVSFMPHILASCWCFSSWISFKLNLASSQACNWLPEAEKVHKRHWCKSKAKLKGFIEASALQLPMAFQIPSVLSPALCPPLARCCFGHGFSVKQIGAARKCEPRPGPAEVNGERPPDWSRPHHIAQPGCASPLPSVSASPGREELSEAR